MQYVFVLSSTFAMIFHLLQWFPQTSLLAIAFMKIRAAHAYCRLVSKSESKRECCKCMAQEDCAINRCRLRDFTARRILGA